MKRYRIPTHLAVEPSLVRAELGPIPVDLTFRQATALALAAGFAYWLWQGSGLPTRCSSSRWRWRRWRPRSSPPSSPSAAARPTCGCATCSITPPAPAGSPGGRRTRRHPPPRRPPPGSRRRSRSPGRRPARPRPPTEAVGTHGHRRRCILHGGRPSMSLAWPAPPARRHAPPARPARRRRRPPRPRRRRRSSPSWPPAPRRWPCAAPTRPTARSRPCAWRWRRWPSRSRSSSSSARSTSRRPSPPTPAPPPPSPTPGCAGWPPTTAPSCARSPATTACWSAAPTWPWPWPPPDPAAAPRGLGRLLARAPAEARPTPDEAARELAARCAELDRRLRPAGVAVRRLAGAELAGLLHRLVQPDLARRQPLPADLADLAAGPVESPPAGARRPWPPPAPGDRGRVLAGYLAPGAAEEAPDWLRVDDRYAATLAVIGYRREVGADWLAPLWRCGLPLRVALHLDPLADRTALGRLERRKTRLEAAAAARRAPGPHPQGGGRRRAGGRDRAGGGGRARRRAPADARAVRDRRGRERRPGSASACATWSRSWAGWGCAARGCASPQPAGYRATLPLGRDEPQRGHAMTGAAVAAAFPVAGGGDAGDGVLLGVDLHGGGLVELPLAGGAEPQPGRARPLRRRQELRRQGGAAPGRPARRRRSGSSTARASTPRWSRRAGGATIRLAPGRGGRRPQPAGAAAGRRCPTTRTTPAPTRSPSASRPSPRWSACSSATARRADGDRGGGRRRGASAPPTRRAGVTADPATWAHPPTLADLQRRLAAGDGTARGLAVRLARHTDGAYAGLFAGAGGAPPDARLLRWDLRDLPEELTAAALLLLADAVWTEARRRPARPPAGHRRGLAPDRPPGRRALPGRPGPARPQARPGPVGDQPGRARPAGGPRTAAPSPPTPPPRCCRRRTTGTIDAVAAAFGLGAGERALLLGAQVGEALLVAGRAAPGGARAGHARAGPAHHHRPGAPCAARPAATGPTRCGRPPDERRRAMRAAGPSARTRPSSSAATRSRRSSPAPASRLRRSGPRLVGRCPFHDDRTPSFTVYPDQATYHCYRLRRARRRLRLHHGPRALLLPRGDRAADRRRPPPGAAPARRADAEPALTERQRAILTAVARAYADDLAAARALDADLAVAPTLDDADPRPPAPAPRRPAGRRGAGLPARPGRAATACSARRSVGWCEGDRLGPLARRARLGRRPN